MIDWSKQHNGVRKATIQQTLALMPDLKEVVKTFPEEVNDFYWDVKVHMLMPNQFPCIPNWHFDNVPRINGKQDFSKIDESKPMYLWVSNPPLTLFRDETGIESVITPQKWYRFTQKDEHKGVMATDFCWRGFIRATHKKLTSKNPSKDHDPLRRHSQVYLDASNFIW